MTSYRETDTVQALPRHLRGFDLLGAKSGATAGETALGSPRLDAKAFLKPASHYFRDTCHRHGIQPDSAWIATTNGVTARRD